MPSGPASFAELSSSVPCGFAKGEMRCAFVSHDSRARAPVRVAQQRELRGLALGRDDLVPHVVVRLREQERVLDARDGGDRGVRVARPEVATLAREALVQREHRRLHAHVLLPLQRRHAGPLHADRHPERELREPLHRRRRREAHDAVDDHLQRRAAMPREDAQQRRQLGVVREQGGHGAIRAVVIHQVGGEPERARRERVVEQRRDARHLVRGRRAFPRVEPQHREPQGDVADERRVVRRHAHAALDRAAVLGPRGPIPRQMRRERTFREVLEEREDLHDLAAHRGIGVNGREREAAVAHHHRGDAVAGQRLEIGLPPHDAVEVRVALDEAGRDDAAARVDDALAGERRERGRHLADEATRDAHVGATCGRPGAVDDETVADQERLRRLHRERLRAGPRTVTRGVARADRSPELRRLGNPRPASRGSRRLPAGAELGIPPAEWKRARR